MSAEAEPPEASEEEFLDQVFEHAVSLLEEGTRPTADDLLAGREHLRADVEALLRTAQQVTLVRSADLPSVMGFTLLSEIGHGAMGRVYLARQQSLGGRRVALKVLPTNVGLSTKARDRFRSEVNAIAALRHHNVVTVHDVIAEQDVNAYAMEWVDGASLGQLIDHLKAKCARNASDAEPDIADVRGLLGATEQELRDPYPVFICRIGIAIARALSAVHHAGFLHRDVKPSNILLRRDGTPLLSDFGLVRELDSTLTQSTQFAGTLMYAPPEQLVGEPQQVDARSDVYALGLTLYHALSLHLPFDERKGRKWRASTPTGMLRVIESGRAAPLRAWNPRLPRDLQTIVARATEPDRARRYASPDELADDLERMLNLQPIRARPAGVFTRAFKFLRRNRASALGIVAGSAVSLVLAALGIIHVFLVPRWVDAHVREARLALLDPAQANAVFNSIFWERPSLGSKASTQTLADAEAHYNAALRWRPFDAAIQAERDVVHRARSADRAPLRELDSRSAGLESFLSGDIDAALAHWEEFDRSRDLTAAPDPLIEAALGILYLVRDEPARAYPRLRAACAAFPHVGYLTSYLADAALRCGDVEYAERLLDAAATMTHLDPFGALERVRANLLAAQGRDAEAEALFRSGRAFSPASLHLARFLESRGRVDEALDEYQHLASQVPTRSVLDPYAACLERWWAALPTDRRRERIRAILQENPDDSRSLIARVRVCASSSDEDRRTASELRPTLARAADRPAPPLESVRVLPDSVALRGPHSSPCLQNRSLAELANILEVDDMARWREIQRFPHVLEQLQLCAWHSPWPHALSDAIHHVATSIRRHSAEVKLRAMVHGRATDPDRLARCVGRAASASPVLRGLAFSIALLVSIGSTFGAQSGSSSVRHEDDSAWYAAASEDIRRAEYAYGPVASERGMWSAPNRSQGFRSRISRAGLEVFPRETAADGLRARWKMQLRATSFGRLGDVRDLPRAAITVGESRVELDHGLLQEWFENRNAGLEQGFSIAERPNGVGPLWIGLELTGDLSLRIDGSGRSGTLVDSCGEVTLRYRDLVVFDARGRELDARLAPSSTGIGIQVDDAAAVYPLTVDPVLTGPAWTAEPDQAGASLGYSVAAAGDVNGDGYSDVLVGAPYFDNGEVDEGRAHLYLGSALGLATTAAWTAESNQVGASFGLSVAAAGDVNADGFSDAVVGAFLYDNGETDEGRAYLYLGSAAGLSTAAAWTAEGNQATDRFARSVATAGDVNGDGYSDVIVGAYQHTNGQTEEGRAYLYLGSAAGLSTGASWTAESNQALAWFGISAATAGDVNGDGFGDVMVGAFAYDNGEADEGRAYLYLGSAAGLSTSASWTAEGNQVGAWFGWPLATAGDVNGDGFSDVIVGAFAFDNGETDEGRAYLYLGSAAGLSPTVTWTAEGEQIGANFGYPVTTAGDVNADGYSDVLVGAPSYDNGRSGEGRAFLYLGSATGLDASAAWSAESDQVDANFAQSLATAGDVDGDGYSDVIVGAPLHDNGETDEGRVFVYSGSSLGLARSAAWTAESNQADAIFGTRLSTAGDVNGDGYSDVIIGAYGFDNDQPGEGRAYLYLGSSSGLATSAAWVAEGNQSAAAFGYEVSTAGDVNGDGYDDVLVGVPNYSNGEAFEGRAYVYLGSSAGLAPIAAWTAESNQATAQVGYRAQSAGDVNGDGFGDVILGAPFFDNGQTDEGRVFVYLGSATGLGASGTPGNADWSAESDQSSALFGHYAATAGDVNGDGYSDVIVGAYLFDNGEVDEGRAFVFVGSSTGLATGAAWTAESNQINARMGVTAATAGDVNGDGFSDVIVGAEQYDNGESDEGAAFVYLGSALGLSTSAAWTAESNQIGGFLGYTSAASSAGDVNADGYSDVIVGAYGYSNGEAQEGGAFLYLGSASGLGPNGTPSNAAWSAESDQIGARFGISCGTAGDVNGDGYSDVIVGAYHYDNGQSDEGRAFVYLGNDGRGGWLLAPQQRSGSAPISLLGRAGSNASFRIRVGFDSALAGFSWSSGSTPTARLEWQVARLGASLDGSTIESGAEQVISGAPIVFDEPARLDLPSSAPLPFGSVNHAIGGPFHWRARVRTNNPLLPVTPWVSMPGNNVTETKLRAFLPAASARAPH